MVGRRLVGCNTMTSMMTSTMANDSASSTIDDLCDATGNVPIDPFSEHRYAGIIPAYFIKPDPVMTRQETRRYIRQELRDFLTGPVFLAHAQAVYDASPALSTEELRSYLTTGQGSWAAARLVVLARLLDSSDLADVGALALAICQSHLDVSAELEAYQGEEVVASEEAEAEAEDSEETVLEGEEATEEEGEGVTDEEEDVNHVALGFILTDRLPQGKTIRSFWDHSPFEALRSAPPLGTSIEERVEYTIGEFLEPLTTLQVPIIACAVVAMAAGFFGYAIGRG
jgi:hypothetical protein